VITSDRPASSGPKQPGGQGNGEGAKRASAQVPSLAEVGSRGAREQTEEQHGMLARPPTGADTTPADPSGERGVERNRDGEGGR
jgi:hypothetical protein